MGIKVGGHIEKVNGKELSYSEFVERYLVKNQPVVLTGLMDDWRACKDWVSHDGQPNLQFFSTHFGKSKVQVADCGTREFTDQKRIQMSVSDFVGHWLGGHLQECSNASNEEDNGRSVLYLKDWHFVKEYPTYLAYTTPLFFRDDWLNMYLENYSMHSDPDAYQENNEISCSDYRFVYMGAKGSWTPLHADVFRSYSWSANLVVEYLGEGKLLDLVEDLSHLILGSDRPYELFWCTNVCLSGALCTRLYIYHKLFMLKDVTGTTSWQDRNLKSCVFNIFGDVSETTFPDFKKAIWLECTQEENEIIFVPSGWYHQVHNLEDTISINHNWFNAFNLSWVWDLLLRDYNEARGYIEDIRDICDDFEGLCQRNLAANTGMNFYDFFIFVTRFSFANLTQLSNLHRDNGSSVWISPPIARHLALNFVSIKKIALKMRSMEGLVGNNGFLDWRETLDDPKFLELSTGLGGTYRMIHKQQNWGCDVKRTFMDNLRVFDFVRTHGSQFCSPDDLIKLIDNVVAKLSGICDEEDILLSRWDDA